MTKFNFEQFNAQNSVSKGDEYISITKTNLSKRKKDIRFTVYLSKALKEVNKLMKKEFINVYYEAKHKKIAFSFPDKQESGSYKLRKNAYVDITGMIRTFKIDKNKKLLSQRYPVMKTTMKGIDYLYIDLK